MRFCVDDGDYETHVDREPRVAHPDERHKVLPLAEEAHEVPPRSLGSAHAIDHRVRVDVIRARGEEVLDVLGRLLDVALDVHRETGRLGDGKTEVEGNAAGNAAETDEDTPHEVDVCEYRGVIVEECVLVRRNNNERDEGSS